MASHYLQDQVWILKGASKNNIQVTLGHLSSLISSCPSILVFQTVHPLTWYIPSYFLLKVFSTLFHLINSSPHLHSSDLNSKYYFSRKPSLNPPLPTAIRIVSIGPTSPAFWTVTNSTVSSVSNGHLESRDQVCFVHCCLLWIVVYSDWQIRDVH